MIHINQSVCYYLNTNLFIITELADLLFNSLKSITTSLFLLLCLNLFEAIICWTVFVILRVKIYNILFKYFVIQDTQLFSLLILIQGIFIILPCYLQQYLLSFYQYTDIQVSYLLMYLYKDILLIVVFIYYLKTFQQTKLLFVFSTKI